MRKMVLMIALALLTSGQMLADAGKLISSTSSSASFSTTTKMLTGNFSTTTVFDKKGSITNIKELERMIEQQRKAKK